MHVRKLFGVYAFVSAWSASVFNCLRVLMFLFLYKDKGTKTIQGVKYN